jgi:ribosomal protein L40E
MMGTILRLRCNCLKCGTRNHPSNAKCRNEECNASLLDCKTFLIDEEQN